MLALLAAGLGLAGGGLSAYGQLRQGRAQKDAAYYNAALEENNANLLDKESAVSQNQLQRKHGLEIGAIHAQYGASGVRSNEGSALDVLQQSVAQASLDQELLKYQYDNKAYGLRQSAQLRRYEGDQAQTSSYYSAAGSLLGSFGGLAGKMG